MAIKTDIVVIGSGVGGLSCGALLASYGYGVIVCESHNLPGGAAHSFKYGGYSFDSGPSLYSGLSVSSANPLRHVLEAIAEPLPCATYDTWGCCLPEGDFDTQVGATQFQEILQKLRGTAAVQQWQKLQQVMAPLGAAAVAVPPAALRFDWGAAITAGKFAPSLLRYGTKMAQLTGPFSRIVDEVVGDRFIRNWLDLLCFLLSGLPADGTSTAEMAFMFADWYRPDVVLDYPIGGSGAVVAALVRGLEKYGGKLWLNAHVDHILIEEEKAVGVQLQNGEIISATRAVVANTSTWDLLKLLPPGSVPAKFREQRQSTAACDSFMHLHLGIDAEGLPELACHYIYVKDWQAGVNAAGNVVLISIPSILDPNLAPPGKHNIHVYTPGNEPYHLWQGLDRKSKAYQKLKYERSQPMWQALERVIPDIRRRCELTLVGTPLTHERFLRRDRGSYGPAIRAGEQLFPGPYTPISGLLCCGDSTFPGIGLPAVAASGMIAANTIAPVSKHLSMLQSINLSRLS